MVPGTAEVIYDRPGVREPSQDALVGLQRFFRQAQSEVKVVNPYLVPGEPFFAEARQRFVSCPPRCYGVDDALGRGARCKAQPEHETEEQPPLFAF